MMMILGLSNLPEDVSIGQLYNLLWLFPSLAGYDLVTRGGEHYLSVTLSNDDFAEHFYTVMHGRKFDIHDPTSKRMIVSGLPFPPAASVTIWGSGFSSQEDPDNVTSQIEALRLEGMRDMRCVMKAKRAMVFVDFDTCPNAWQALETLAPGLKLKTGRCHFEMSRGR